MTDRSKHPIVHFVGSIPLPDSETVFRTLSKAVGPHLVRLPDGETGIRKSWIRFLQDVLSGNSAIEFAKDVPPFKFVQWDGKLVREIPRLRVKPGATIDPASVRHRLCRDGDRVVGRVRAAAEGRRHSRRASNSRSRFRRRSRRPTTTWCRATGRSCWRRWCRISSARSAKIAKALPNDRIAIQWDVCQEVLAWENYYDKGPVDFRTETIDVLTRIGDGVPAGIELGYHLCYGSPADEHMVLPKDMGIMVEMTNAIVAGVKRPIQFFHMPVVKARTDDAYFAPLKNLKLRPGTELYLGLIHHNDASGDAARLAAARRHARVDGIGTECGMARGDPARLPALLAAHAAGSRRKSPPRFLGGLTVRSTSDFRLRAGMAEAVVAQIGPAARIVGFEALRAVRVVVVAAISRRGDIAVVVAVACIGVVVIAVAAAVVVRRGADQRTGRKAATESAPAPP